MILIKSSRLVYLFGILLMIFIPLLNYLTGDLPKDGNEPLGAFISVIIPIFVITELLLYLFFGVLSGGGASIYYLIQYSMMLFLFRLLCCFLSGLIFSDYNETQSLNSLLYFWMGNPLVILFQVFMLMMLGPYLAWCINPRIISDKAIAYVGERKGILETIGARYMGGDVMPVGGFVRVYTFDELGRLFMNVIGIEGYIMYTHEGLILSKDCQLRFDMDRLVAVSVLEWKEHKASQLKIGFNESERIISQTAEHNFIHVSFNQAFFGIYIFKRNVGMDEVLNRLEPLARSARELLEMKYSPII